jgi:hypothetical protein
MMRTRRVERKQPAPAISVAQHTPTGLESNTAINTASVAICWQRVLGYSSIKALVAITKGHLRTCGAIQLEFELFNGRLKARCYPFDLPKHHFWGETLKVYHDVTIYHLVYQDICTDILYDVFSPQPCTSAATR